MAKVADGAIVKKYHVWYFLNNGTTAVPDWVRIEKSTESTISMNGETVVFDFIADESPTTVLDRYAPSISHPITMYKGNPDFEMCYNLFFNLKTGSEANKELLIVFMNSEPSADKWDAWSCNALLTTDTADFVGSIITVTLTTIGTIKRGTVEITDGDPVFTENPPPVTP